MITGAAKFHRVHIPAYPSPQTACTMARAAIAAVSARKMRGPSDTERANAILHNIARSSAVKPPSGPTSTAKGPA